MGRKSAEQQAYHTKKGRMFYFTDVSVLRTLCKMTSLSFKEQDTLQLLASCIIIIDLIMHIVYNNTVNHNFKEY